MTNDEVKSMIEAAQAYLDGKRLQFMDVDGNWVDFSAADGYHPLLTYRVKLEPIVRWANIYPEGATVHPNEDKAREMAGQGAIRVAVKLVEAQ